MAVNKVVTGTAMTIEVQKGTDKAGGATCCQTKVSVGLLQNQPS